MNTQSKKTLKLKIIGPIVLTLTTLMGVTLIVCFNNVKAALHQELESKGSSIVSALTTTYQNIESLDASTIQGYLDEYKKIPGVSYVFVRNERGEFVAHTFSPGIPKEFKNDQIQLNAKKTTRIIDFKRNEVLDISAPIMNGVLGRVHIGMNLSDVTNRAMSPIFKSVLWVTLLLGITGITYLYLSVSRITSQLIKYAEELTKSKETIDYIEKIVAERTKKLKELQRISVLTAHQSGMSEIATGILHNVGNVLNSANVGLELILQKFEKSVVQNLFKANDLLMQNRNRLGEFFTIDPKGKKLVDFYLELGEAIKNENSILKYEATELMKRLTLIKDIINTQQTYAKGNAEFKENISLLEIVENALVMQTTALTRHEIKVVKKFSEVPPVLAQRAKLLHVVLNLLKNAKEAMGTGDDREKILTLEIGQNDHGGIFLRVTDTGIGISGENLPKVFTHGFTTKQAGHGFGLHFCANSATEMGAKITVTSEGLGQGASFVFEFEGSKLAHAV